MEEASPQKTRTIIRMRFTATKIFFYSLLSLFCSYTFTNAQLDERTNYSIEGDILTCGKARFEFLDPTLTRMEYSSDEQFVDVPTAIVTGRNMRGKRPIIEEKDDWLVINTGNFTLRYRLNSGKFTNKNLQLSWKLSGIEHSWSPGDSDLQNLGGIVPSLDGSSKKNPPKFQPGILSRNGYFLLDDSHSPCWDTASQWITPRKDADAQDYYFFLYGEDYKLALRQFAKLCGNIPLIPRYTLGAWITDLNYEYLKGTDLVENYKYTDQDVRKIVTRFRHENIPLDILVLDFGWHNFGWKGGYDWSPIFPDPTKFLVWAHDNGLKISLNDHPGYGEESILSNNDSHAPEIRKQLNLPVPPEPKYYTDISQNWKFSIDPKLDGIPNQWFDLKFDDSKWKTLQGAALWEDQGFPDYDGIAWYRKWISIPAITPHPLYLLFGGVDDEYDLYINGNKITHYGSPGKSVYNSLTSTDISGIVKPGEKNLITLRVNDWGGGGGIVAAPVALSDQLPPKGIRFNLASKHQAEVFMNVLHYPLIDEGIDFWWIDGGRGSCDMPGLNPQMWTNRVYYDFTEEHSKKRAFVFSRYGGWGSHRYPGLFTGDTYSDWEVLASEIPYTTNGGNALIPYITHDIGGFLGENISFDLYARWIEFGTFSPFLRLHSAYENPKDGNKRMPWNYGARGLQLAKKYFNLRYHLIPYIYTLCRTAQDSSLPLVRPLYLEYPKLARAYNSPSEYMFGSDLLVAPITDSSGERDTYLPPGEWIDYFTGERLGGDQTIHQQYSLMDMPVFARAGSIIPGAPIMSSSDKTPLDTLIVDVYGIGKGQFKLYEDDGISLAYRNGEYAWTTLSHEKAIGGGEQITIAPAEGIYAGMPTKRAYIIKLHGMPSPSKVKVDARSLSTKNIRWEYDHSVTSIHIPKVSIRELVRVLVR
ncbi:MAG: TIM-barrel domain-containing protein [Bacteroidota bacterium]